MLVRCAKALTTRRSCWGMAGFDERDPATVETPVPDYRRELEARPRKLRVGVVRTPFFDSLDAEIADAVEKAIEKLRERATFPSTSSTPRYGVRSHTPITRDGSRSRQRSISRSRANESFRPIPSVRRITHRLAVRLICCVEASGTYSGLWTF